MSASAKQLIEDIIGLRKEPVVFEAGTASAYVKSVIAKARSPRSTAYEIDEALDAYFGALPPRRHSNPLAYIRELELAHSRRPQTVWRYARYLIPEFDQALQTCDTGDRDLFAELRIKATLVAAANSSRYDPEDKDMTGLRDILWADLAGYSKDTYSLKFAALAFAVFKSWGMAVDDRSLSNILAVDPKAADMIITYIYQLPTITLGLKEEHAMHVTLLSTIEGSSLALEKFAPDVEFLDDSDDYVPVRGTDDVYQRPMDDGHEEREEVG